MFLFEPIVDTVVAGVEVPRGAPVVLLIRPPATDAKNFRDPERFVPARWLEPKAQGPHEPSAHQPFGSGPRICPGRSLALLEMRLVLAMLLHRFDVERVGSAADVRERFAFTMMPVGLKVRLRPRRLAAPSQPSAVRAAAG